MSSISLSEKSEENDRRLHPRSPESMYPENDCLPTIRLGEIGLLHYNEFSWGFHQNSELATEDLHSISVPSISSGSCYDPTPAYRFGQEHPEESEPQESQYDPFEPLSAWGLSTTAQEAVSDNGVPILMQENLMSHEDLQIVGSTSSSDGSCVNDLSRYLQVPAHPVVKRRSSSVAEQTGDAKKQKAPRRQRDRKSSACSSVYDPDDDSNSTAEPVFKFACPFLRLQPALHIECLNRRLSRIRDVKQHLQRQHLEPPSCPLCWDMFPDARSRDEHIQQQKCEKRGNPNSGNGPRWVSEQALSQIRKKPASRTMTPEQQWFDLWDMLFPSNERPAHAFLGDVFEETLTIIHDMWQNNAASITESLLDGQEVKVMDASQVTETVTLALRSLRLREKVQGTMSRSGSPTSPRTRNSRISPIPASHRCSKQPDTRG